MLRAGIGAETYSRALARTLSLDLLPVSVAVVGLGRGSSLGQRLDRIDHPGRYRVMLRHRLAVAATVVALAAVSYLPLRATSAVQQTLPVGGVGAGTPAVAAGTQAFATLAGIVTDNTGGVLPGTTLRLTNFESQSTREVVTDGRGRFEFVGVPPGDYLREIILPGFQRQVSRLTMAWQDVHQDVALPVGSLEETVLVTRGDAPGAISYRRDPRRDALVRSCSDRRARNRAAGTSAVVGGNTAPPVQVRVGGNISPPVKVRDVPPRYPRGANAVGTVVLDVVIGADGFLDENELKVVGAAHPDLVSAAIQAVRQWEYHSTLLNCVPIPVSMTVNVDFRNPQ